MLDHVRRHAVPQLMRAGLATRHAPHHRPHHLRRQRMSAHTQKQSPLHPSTRLQQLRPPALHISLQRLHSRAPDRHNPLLIALAANLHTRRLQPEILLPQRNDFPHPQPTRIQQLQNRVVPQRRPARISRTSRNTRHLQHVAHFALGQALRQHLPARRRLDIHRRITPHPLVLQQPPIKPPQTAQLPRNRPRLDPMLPQMLHKPAHMRLLGPHQPRTHSLQKLRKHLQVPLIRLTRQRPQPTLHRQVRPVLPHQHHITHRIRPNRHPSNSVPPGGPPPAPVPTLPRPHLRETCFFTLRTLRQSTCFCRCSLPPL